MTTPINTAESRIAGVKVADVKMQPMGPLPGIRARLVLVDEESNPLAFVVNNHFSPKTLKIIEALYKSLEEDYVAIITRGPAAKEAEMEFPTDSAWGEAGAEEEGDDDGGVHFP